VYWTNASGGTVMKVAIDGGTPTTLASGQDAPNGIAVGGSYVYWANAGVANANSYFTSGTLMKVPVAGGSLTTLASGSISPAAVAVDSSGVYFVDETMSASGNGALAKVAASGGTTTTLGAASNPGALAIEASTVYWIDNASDGGAVLATPK
jgi:hypothetical protein